MPSAGGELIINRFRVYCTQHRNRFRWPMQCALRWASRRFISLIWTRSRVCHLVSTSTVNSSPRDSISGSTRESAILQQSLPCSSSIRTSRRSLSGLETMAGRRELADTIRIAGAERIVFSLDLFEGRPRTAAAATWGNEDSFDLALAAIDCGVQNLLILDLARVGTGRGLGSQTLIAQIRGARPFAHIHAGGGISRIEEVLAIRDAGAAGVLVGSAIHDGRIGTRRTRADQCTALSEGSSFRRLDVSAPLHLRRLAKALLNFDTHDAGEFPTAGGHRLAKPSRDIVREQLGRRVGDGK